MTKAFFRRKIAALLGLALLSAGITCTNLDRTSPVRFSAAVGLIPAFSKGDDSIAQTLGSLSVTINNVHIVLLHEDGSVVVDTTIAVGPNDEEVELELEVALTKSSEALSAAIELRNGTMVLFSGTQHIVVVSGTVTDTKQDTIAVTYSGPGATAASVVVSPKDSTIRSVDSIAFSAVAKDAQGATLSNLLVGWSVKDPTIGSVSTAGMFHPANANVRGSTYVVGVLPTGIKDSARVFVTPVATQVVLVSGGAQTGAAGSALANPLVVEVRASDNLPVPGVNVTFAATSGGGSLAPTSAVSSSAASGTGQASTTLTLGTAAGTNTYTATIAGATPLSVNETAVAGAAAKLIIVTKPSATTASGAVFAQQPVVRIADANGNTVTASTASVTASASAGYTLSGTSTMNAVAGVVTYTNLAVAGPAGTATIGFASSALGKDSAGTTVSAGAAASVAPIAGATASDTIDATLAASSLPALVVKDAQNNPIQGATVKFTRLGHPGGAINGTADTVTVLTGVNGQAAVPTRRLPPTIGFDTVLALVNGLPDSVRFVAAVVPGKPNHLAFASQPANTPANVDIGFTIGVLDRLNNLAVPGPQPSITVAIKSGTGDPSAVLSAGTGSALTVTAVNGTATFAIRIDKFASAYQITASATGLTLATSNAFNINGGTPAGLFNVTPLVRLDTIDAIITHVDTVPTVVVRDAQSQPVAGVVVKFRKHAGASASLNGLASNVDSVFVTTGSDGKAALTSWKMRTGWGVDTVYATSPSVTDTVMFNAVVLAGKATHMTFVSQPAGSFVTNATFGVAVALRDRLDSVAATVGAVSPVTATISIKPATGDNSATLTPISPTASLTQDVTAGTGVWLLALDKIAVGYKLVVASTGLTSIETNAFDITAGAVASITALTSTTVSDTIDAPVTAPSVILKDAISQPVSGTLVTFTRRGGTGSLLNGLSANVSVATGVDGKATLSSRALQSLVGFDTVLATVSGLTDTVRFVATVANGKPHHLVFSSQPSAPLAAGATFSWAVDVQDRLNNPAKTYDGGNVTLAIKTGTGTLGALLLPALSTTATTSNGTASFVLHVDLAGTAYQLTASYTGVSSLDSSPFDVTVGAPSSIVVVQGDNQSSFKNLALTDSVVVFVKDAVGNGVAGVSPTFNLPGGGSSSGPATTDATGRIARRWTVGSSGVQTMGITAGSASATVTAYIAEKLAVVSEPTASPERGVVFASQPKVQVQDNQGHQVKVSGVNVAAFATLTVLCDCAGPTLSGTTTLNTDANGEAQFTDLMLFGTVGGQYHIRFDDTSESLTSVFGQNQTLIAGVATHLAFSVQPPNATIGAPFSVTVQAMTAGGFVDASFADDITIALGATPGGALTGTLTISASNGTATFSDLVVDQVGTGYTLVASSGTLTNATSNAFSVVAPVDFNALALPTYATASHTCGASTTNAIYCWGSDQSGQMGLTPPIGGDCVGGTEVCPKPIQVQGLPGALTSLTAGSGFTCGLSSATAYCWGGDGYISQAYAPHAVGGTTQFVSISAGANHMCGIDTGGSLNCWGYNGYGNLGTNDLADKTAPTGVYGGGTYVAVSAGQANTCAIATGGIAFCWGDNSNRQLGNSVFSGSFSNIPVQVTGANVWAKIATGQTHACGIDNTGTTYCWGSNQFGESGDNQSGFLPRVTPSLVAGGHTFVSISSAEYFSCAVDTNGDGYCWGRGDDGQLGTGGTGSQSAPALVAGGHSWTSIKTGNSYACGVTTGNRVYCWGRNLDSQLGNGSTSDPGAQPTPMLISAPGAYDPCSQGCALRAQPVKKKKG